MWDLYLLEQRAKGLSPYTIEKAQRSWRELQKYQPCEPHELSRELILGWHAWLHDRGLKPNTVHSHAQVLGHFQHWLKARGALTYDIPAVPPAGKPSRAVLTPEQAVAVLDALSRSRQRVRNRAIITLFLATGLRLSELAGLTLADCQGGLLRVRAETSKGKRDRVVPLGIEAQRCLQEYLAWGRYGSQEPALFLAETGDPLGRSGIHLMLKRAMRRAGVPWASAHILRHTFATQSLLGGLSAFHVQALMGHASIRSTEPYVNLAALSDAQRAGQMTPADRLLRGRPRR